MTREERIIQALVEKTEANAIIWAWSKAPPGYEKAFRVVGVGATPPPVAEPTNRDPNCDVANIWLGVEYSGSGAMLAINGDEAVVSTGPEAIMCDLLRAVACNISRNAEGRRATALDNMEQALGVVA